MTKRTKQPRLFNEMDEREEYERALFTAICTACGFPFGQLTKTARGRVQKAVKELAEIQATIEQVAIVARGMRAEYKTDGVVTPQGLTGNWPKFVGGTATDKRLAKEKKAAEMEQLKRQENARRVYALDEATLNGLRGRLGGDYLTAPKNDCWFHKGICDLLDAASKRDGC